MKSSGNILMQHPCHSVTCGVISFFLSRPGYRLETFCVDRPFFAIASGKIFSLKTPEKGSQGALALSLSVLNSFG
jgi:hypothetical protein